MEPECVKVIQCSVLYMYIQRREAWSLSVARYSTLVYCNVRYRLKRGAWSLSVSRYSTLL